MLRHRPQTEAVARARHPRGGGCLKGLVCRGGWCGFISRDDCFVGGALLVAAALALRAWSLGVVVQGVTAESTFANVYDADNRPLGWW